MLKAVTRSARAVDARVNNINAERASRGQSKITVAYYFDHYSTDADSDVMVTEEDFYLAKDDLVPSVSVDELRHYEHVRNTFEGAAKSIEEAPAALAEEATASRPEEVMIAAAQRSGKSEQNGTGARARAMEALKRLGKGKHGGMNGNANPSHANATAGQSPVAVEDDDDYVIRTEKLALSNGSERPSSSRGKGKGKGKAREVVIDGPSIGPPAQDGFGNGNGEQGEDLYD